MNKLFAEFLGTLILVLFGCGSAVLAPEGFDQLAISFGFGLAIVAIAYGLGPISGGHVNPAVSFGMFLAGRMTMNDFISYAIAQIIGALAGAAILYVIVMGQPSPDPTSLGQNGFGVGSPGGYSMAAGFVFEAVATFIFVAVILGSTQPGAPAQMAGLAIGLTLCVIHIVGIQVTGVSVNPARSIGPAVFVGGTALTQLWLFVAAPLLGAAAAGILYKQGLLRTKD